jgi:hypothetical protein
VDAGGMVTAAETHVGIAVDGKHLMHVEPGIDTVVEKLTSPRIARRMTRVFRHVSLT